MPRPRPALPGVVGLVTGVAVDDVVDGVGDGAGCVRVMTVVVGNRREYYDVVWKVNLGSMHRWVIVVGVIYDPLVGRLVFHHQRHLHDDDRDGASLPAPDSCHMDRRRHWDSVDDPRGHDRDYRGRRCHRRFRHHRGCNRRQRARPLGRAGVDHQGKVVGGLWVEVNIGRSSPEASLPHRLGNRT